MRGFLKLTWLEIKIFWREPMGLIGSVLFPVIIFLILGRSLRSGPEGSERMAAFLGQGLPIFVSILIALSAAISLIAVISIYREGGILKRLRATPLRPTTILSVHVVVKLIFTAVTLSLMMLVGRRFYPVDLDVHFVSFGLALLVSTLSIISIGFVIASLVPTARFAQPIGSAIFYPMLAISGLFVPLAAMPKMWASIGSVLPITNAVTLLRGAWAGESWMNFLPELGLLALTFVVFSVIASRVFRWE
jgi:ABC-2 type transport system permease protein